MLVDSRKVVDMQREKQAERLKQAEKHLSDMEHSRELIEKDLREAYESYKLGMTDKETYLEQRKTYEQMLASLQENIRKTEDSSRQDGRCGCAGSGRFGDAGRAAETDWT